MNHMLLYTLVPRKICSPHGGAPLILRSTQPFSTLGIKLQTTFYSPPKC
jgi:hypothetical protein